MANEKNAPASSGALPPEPRLIALAREALVAAELVKARLVEFETARDMTHAAQAKHLEAQDRCKLAENALNAELTRIRGGGTP